MSQISSLLLIILTFLTIQSLPEDNIVIGIFTQKYFYGDHMPVDGSVLTYLSPTYVNLASMTGAKVVPIYSYTSKTEILAQLEKVNGVIFTGGEQHIFINTTWTANSLVVLEYAIKQNDEGRTFPILGICQGLQQMLYLTSDMRVPFFDTIYNQNGVWNTINIVEKDYYLIDGVSDNTLAAMTDSTKTPQGGPMFFYHSNSTLVQTFKRDKDLTEFWDLIATTSKGNQTFVSYLEAKEYPFYITQFHPQRLSFNKNMSNTLFQARGQIATTIALNFAMKCKQSPHRYARSELTNDIIDNFAMYSSKRFTDYNVYLFNEWSSQSLRKQEATQEGYVQTGRLVGLVMFVGLLGGAGYLYKKKKQQTEQRNNPNFMVQNEESYRQH